MSGTHPDQHSALVGGEQPRTIVIASLERGDRFEAAKIGIICERKSAACDAKLALDLGLLTSEDS